MYFCFIDLTAWLSSLMELKISPVNCSSSSKAWFSWKFSLPDIANWIVWSNRVWVTSVTVEMLSTFAKRHFGLDADVKQLLKEIPGSSSTALDCQMSTTGLGNVGQTFAERKRVATYQLLSSFFFICVTYSRHTSTMLVPATCCLSSRLHW